MLSENLIKALDNMLGHHDTRLNAHAEDITELTGEVARNIEDIGKLTRRIEELEERRDSEDLEQRLEELEGRLTFLTARHNRITEPAKQERAELACRIEDLARRIDKLEEKED